MTRRPKINDEDVVTRAAAMLAEDVPDDYGTLEERVKDLREALSYALSSDGYDIAKELERLGWDVDADLVADLDGGGLHDALEEMEIEWVEREQRKPALGVGAVVKVLDRGQTYEGVVYDIDLKRGKYSVRVPALGHVVKGELGVQGLLLAWEAVEADAAPTA